METNIVMQSGGMTLDDFIGHKTRDKREDTKASYLSGWRKRENAHRNKAGDLQNDVTVWLHTRALFAARWTHNWPKIVDLAKTQTRAVWTMDCLCLEDESTLRRQYRRDRDGNRDSPPVLCPVCLLNEEVRGLVKAGKIKWTDVLFRYEAGKDVKELHSGGLYGAYGKQNLTDDERKELAAAEIYPKEAWKENAVAKCNYVCRVVDNDHPEKGVQISIELDSIGDAMKRKLAAEIEGRGDVGNPMLNPYALQWRYYPEEADFRKKFDVIPMPRIALTDEVRSLITEVDPPSIEHLMTPRNMKMLRASMEQHCLFELNWDAIFGPAEKFCDENGVFVDPKKVDAPLPDQDSDEIPF
jgi:hypothetical protein